MTTTTLESILTSLETAVHPDITTHIIGYMRDLPRAQAGLVEECATHLERSQTLGAVLAVVHALNGGEILLRHQEGNGEEDIDSDALEFKIERRHSDIENLTFSPLVDKETLGAVAANGDDIDCDELSLEIERLLAEEDEKKPGACSLTTKAVDA